MEDKPQDPSATPQPTGGVMDVQPPQGGQAPAATPAPTAALTPPVAPQSVAPAPAASASPENNGLSPELLAQAQQETTPQTSPAADKNAKPPKTPGKKGHKAVILVAVAVALILSGVAIFAYMATQKKDATDNHTDDLHTETTTTKPTEQAKPATATDVENMAKELDDTVNSKDEAEDLPDGGLNESATGL